MKTVQNQAFWREILDEVASMIFVFRIESDDSVQLIYANDVIQRYLGYSPQDFVLQSEDGGALAPVVNALIDELAEKSHHPPDKHLGSASLPEIGGRRVSFDYAFRLFQSSASRTPLMVVTFTPPSGAPIPTSEPGFVAVSSHMKDLLAWLPTLAKQRQALWFHGEPGIGKRMIAKHYAALLGKPVVHLTREVAKAGVPDGCVLWIDDLTALKTKDPLPMKGVIGVVVSELSPDAARNQGLLNEAWYFSQNMQVVSIAPMRYRKEDVAALIDDTIDRLSAMMRIEEPTLKRLRSTSPPDDADMDEIRTWVMGQILAVNSTRMKPVVDVKSWDEQSADALKQVLDACGGRIYGKDGAAAKLGLKPTTLQSKMKRLGVR